MGLEQKTYDYRRYHVMPTQAGIQRAESWARAGVAL